MVLAGSTFACIYSSDALGTGYDVKSSMSPFGDRRYVIKYLRRLRFLISGPNELTELKFNINTPKDLYNLIKKNLCFFLAKTGCQKTAFFIFFKCLF